MSDFSALMKFWWTYKTLSRQSLKVSFSQHSPISDVDRTKVCCNRRWMTNCCACKQLPTKCTIDFHQIEHRRPHWKSENSIVRALWSRKFIKIWGHLIPFSTHSSRMFLRNLSYSTSPSFDNQSKIVVLRCSMLPNNNNRKL